MNSELIELSQKQWYTQGFAARPIFLFGVPSIDTMYEGLGFCYQVTPMLFKRDYCEYNYPLADLQIHADIILGKISDDAHYLQKQRAHYEKELAQNEKVFVRAEKDLTPLSDKKLFALAQDLIRPLELTAGVAHLIESISLRLEHDIRACVRNEKDSKIKNADFSALASPVTQSFLSGKDEALWKIKNATEKKKTLLIAKFMKEFFWIQSSYVQNVPLTEKTILTMAEEVESFTKPNFSELKKQKEVLFTKHTFSEKEKNFVHMAEFLTDWQDERKAHIYRGIYAVSALCRELSRRFNIEEKLVHYLLLNEFNLKDFASGKAKKLAQERYNGVLIVRRPKKFTIYTQSDYEEFAKVLHNHNTDIEKINGIAANLGTATGPVRICTTLASLEKVQKGDVLVASMTRPEYVSGMKKAVAIVTDEGGITCHAAIVSRELGIPCIVGTKNATKSLKDGWIVEVKANHGQVIVLEKK